MMTYITATPEETEALGARIAKALEERGDRHAFVALFGDLGVGKTAFTRGFATYLGCRSVKSPTYTVVNEYRSGRIPVFHFDMYRLSGEDDLLSIGFDEYLDRAGYCISEWSENITEFLPDHAIRVTITRTDHANGRQVTVENGEELTIC